jgi:hypothetical protein
LLTEVWDDFVAPPRKVAFGSEVVDPKKATTWRAGPDGTMQREH